VRVALPAGATRTVKRLVRVTCPPGMTGRGLTQPRYANGQVALRNLREYQLSNRDMDVVAGGGHGRHTVAIRYAAARNLPAPVVVTVGTVCKR
jgi:hypothetical protein